MRPAYMTATRSAMSATTPMSWVIRTTAVWRSMARCRSRSRICAWMVTSSAVVGSSAISIVGAGDQRGSDHDALAHAAGEFERALVDAAVRIGDADILQHLSHRRSGAVERLA